MTCHKLMMYLLLFFSFYFWWRYMISLTCTARYCPLLRVGQYIGVWVKLQITKFCATTYFQGNSKLIWSTVVVLLCDHYIKRYKINVEQLYGIGENWSLHNFPTLKSMVAFTFVAQLMYGRKSGNIHSERREYCTCFVLLWNNCGTKLYLPSQSFVILLFYNVKNQHDMLCWSLKKHYSSFHFSGAHSYKIITFIHGDSNICYDSL